MRRKGKVQPADLQRELALGGLFVVIEQLQDAAARWLGACWIEKVLGRDPTPALVPVATLIVNRWRRKDHADFCVHAGASSPAHSGVEGAHLDLLLTLLGCRDETVPEVDIETRSGEHGV